MRRSVSLSSRSSRKLIASRTLTPVNSWMLRSPTVTARLVGLRRAPRHSGQTRSLMYSSIFWRTSLGLGLGVAPLEVSEDAVEAGRVVAHAALVVAVAHGHSSAAGAVEEEVAMLLGQVVPGRLEVDLEGLGDRRDDLLEPAERELPVRQQRPLGDRDRTVRDDQAGVDLARGPEPVARRTRPVRAVEREHPGLDLGQRDAAVHAGELLAEGEGGPVGELDVDEAVGELGGGLDGVGQPPPQPVLHHQAVDDDGDVVLVLLVEVEAARRARAPGRRPSRG